MRSKLFVPGSRPELFAKALAGEADAISLDLEDAVEESRKGEARGAVAAFLSARRPGADGKVIIVRVNGLVTPHFDADLDAVAGANVDLVNLPMVETPDDVRAAADALARRGSALALAQPIRLLVSIETPRALRLAAEIGKADPRVAGLQLGFADLRLAAGEAGVFAYDAAFADVADADGYRREADVARRLGFIGKSCIHPRQVPIANAVFRPSEQEIVHALRVIEASRQAAQAGVGAYLVDGRMVDAPFVRRAQDVVVLAGRLGLLPATDGGRP